jgi:hypothetical protein
LSARAVLTGEKKPAARTQSKTILARWILFKIASTRSIIKAAVSACAVTPELHPKSLMCHQDGPKPQLVCPRRPGNHGDADVLLRFRSMALRPRFSPGLPLSGRYCRSTSGVLVA